MPEIRRIGSYLEVDDDGFLQKTASASNMTGAWREMVEAATAICIERWQDDLHSVYVRGSVANGCAIEGVSDVDVIVVLRTADFDRETTSSWSREAESSLEERFPENGGFELVRLSEKNVLTHGSPDSVVGRRLGRDCRRHGLFRFVTAGDRSDPEDKCECDGREESGSKSDPQMYTPSRYLPKNTGVPAS